MASHHSSMPWNPNSFDELRWVIQIRRTLDEELEDDNGIPVSIFNVPKSLTAIKPEAYTPQLVAIGPYHHWRTELYEMERYKLSAARRTQKQLLVNNLKFQNLVEQFAKFEPKIRASYHRYLDFNGETLAWIMAVDASFLLEFLQIYALKNGVMLTRVSSRMSHLVDYAGRKSAHNSILKDIMMLENQIPLFLLRKHLDFQYGSLEKSDEFLSMMLKGLCKELSPFKSLENLIISEDCLHRNHLLEFLYYLFVPKHEEQHNHFNGEIFETNDLSDSISEEETSTVSASCNSIKHLVDTVWGFLSSLDAKPVHHLKQVLKSRAMKLLVKFPWRIISNLPVLSFMKQPVESLFFNSNDKESFNTEDQKNKTPLIEEISIPSVTELWNAGVKFCASNGDLTTINFDVKSVTFYLTTVNLDVNTEVILRNLVAYEACSAPGALVFTRYIELMNGIIDTEEDVKLLRRKGIILNHLKSDGEVANLWNSMSKSVKLTKVAFLDKVIEDVNRYYNGRWKVKTGKFMKKYVFGSWQFLTFLAAVLLLLLTGLQTFCSVYNCAHWFPVKTMR